VECAAVGVPSDIGEDEVKAVIVPRGPEVSHQAVMEYCQANLPKYMWPRYIEFVGELPKLPNQKLDKVRMRADGVNAFTWDAEKLAFAA
jgi:crotonobetaine/carnitine-CoA ligase